jgi:hypothetical protein
VGLKSLFCSFKEKKHVFCWTIADAPLWIGTTVYSKQVADELCKTWRKVYEVNAPAAALNGMFFCSKKKKRLRKSRKNDEEACMRSSIACAGARLQEVESKQYSFTDLLYKERRP